MGRARTFYQIVALTSLGLQRPCLQRTETWIHLAPSCFFSYLLLLASLLLLVRHLLLEAMHLLLIASLLLIVRPGAPSSFLFLVAMPFAPSSVLVPSSDGLQPTRDGIPVISLPASRRRLN